MIDGELAPEAAFAPVIAPFRGFMETRVDPSTLDDAAEAAPRAAEPADGGAAAAAPDPAFLLGEIKRGFEVGFLIFLPFLVIDLVIAAVLMSMGMMMVPPAIVSLPFKLAFFVIADGWSLLAGAHGAELRAMSDEPTLVPSPAAAGPGRRRAGAAARPMPSPIEKAAIILTAIGPERRRRFLRGLAEPDLARFARALTGLGKVRQDVLDAVIVEFLEAADRRPRRRRRRQGGAQAARRGARRRARSRGCSTAAGATRAASGTG